MKVVFQVTSAKPVVDKHGNQSSEIFRAGHEYELSESHPNFNEWMERAYIYPAGTKPKSEPQHPFLQAVKSEEAVQAAIAETAERENSWRRGVRKQQPRRPE